MSLARTLAAQPSPAATAWQQLECLCSSSSGDGSSRTRPPVRQRRSFQTYTGTGMAVNVPNATIPTRISGHGHVVVRSCDDDSQKKHGSSASTRRHFSLWRSFSRTRSEKDVVAAVVAHDNAINSPFLLDVGKRELTSNTASPASKPSQPHVDHESAEAIAKAPQIKLDQINSLIANPALYDPIRKPRNPIILCHGLYGFDTLGFDTFPALRIHYWADVLAILRGVVGIEPIITTVPGTGSIVERAQKLHKSLATCAKDKDINLVAHSMGGLDCRHLLTHIKPKEFNALSLTTIATPHRGSHFMAWCQANIGIGDIARAAAAAAGTGASVAAAAASAVAEAGKGTGLADLPIPGKSALPYSLKAPLLSRASPSISNERSTASRDSKANAVSIQSQEAASDVSEAASGEGKPKSATKTAAQALINFPGLNYTLNTSLGAYLLDLLDSPAYANLAPEFLAKHFNPMTPDVPGVKYYSVAARCPKLPITHPLWLPKLILDKTEQSERAAYNERMERIRLEREASPFQPSQDVRQEAEMIWGNDGLVPVYSAKWGEFLGCLENTDHWAVRGGSGLNPDGKSKKKVGVAGSSQDNATSSTEEPTSTRQEDQAKTPASQTSFGWQDVAKEVGSRIAQRDTYGGWSSMSEPDYKASYARSDKHQSNTGPILQSKTTSGAEGAFTTLASIAGWIARRIPIAGAGSPPLSDATNVDPKSVTATAKDAAPKDASDAARLMFGLSSTSSSSSSSNGNSTAGLKPAKFDRERFYVALCRKLYNEGF